MSNSQQFSKHGFNALVRLPAGPLDAVAFASRHHLVVCVTAVVDGRREIVGVDVQPLPMGLDLAAWPERGTGEVTERLRGVLERFMDFPASSLQPVSAELLRGIPLTAVLAFRAHDVAGRQKIGRVMAEHGVSTGVGRDEISAHDELRLSYLDDALMYVDAMQEGMKPAEVIARDRSISKRTAEGRIAKARALGLLTEADGRRASGELTPEALRLQDWRTRVTPKRQEKTDG